MAASPTAIQPGTPPPNTPALDDFYVPAYRVLINGKDEKQLVPDIVSVTFHDSLTDVDSVDLVVNNWDPGNPVRGQVVQGKFRYHNTHIFDPWQDIEVWMGYYRRGKEDFTQMMLGEISSMAPNFPASGGSTLTVRALSFLHQFRIQQKSLQFPKMTDSEIAEKIVKDINKDAQKKVTHINIEMSKDDLEANKPNEKPHPYLEMHNQYPIVFLMQRSREIGYDIWIKDTTDQTTHMRTVTFHYGPSKSVTRPTYVLVWGRSLISFQPTVQTARQVNAVTVNGWNAVTKKPISETVTRADLVKKNEKVIAPEDLGMAENQLAQKMEIVVDRPLNTPKAAKEAAEAALLKLAQGLVTGKGKTIGLPELRAGRKVKICMNPLDIDPAQPPLDRFSGIYEITETTHTISDSGYTTDFSCRMETKT
jgi:phage protein D